MHESLNQLFFFIFSGAAILATLALFGRQPLIIAYIALGILIGPYSLQWVTDIETISSISEIGIIILDHVWGAVLWGSWITPRASAAIQSRDSVRPKAKI